MVKNSFLKNLFSLIFFISLNLGKAQQYITVSSKTADELVKDVFIGPQNASCISVSNISVNGWQDYGNYPFSYGYFEKGTLPFDIEKGIILSTGAAANAAGPNNTTIVSDGAGSDWVGDPDLLILGISGKFMNATSLEFDFVANNITGISFDYMFLSEEYHGTSGCNYSDAFAFLIKEVGSSNYENIATVLNLKTGNLDPVSSTSVRDNTFCQPRNEEYFGRYNIPPSLPRNLSPTTFDGQTKVLTAKKDNIIPGKKYHIKLVIADHGSNANTQYDSAVFLKAGSFVGKKDLGPDLLISTNNPLCEGSSDKIIDATTAGASSYKWFKDGVELIGQNNPTLSIPAIPASAGKYEVEINLSGCILRGSVIIEIGEKAIAPLGTFSVCDKTLSGSVPINFDELNPQIISNYNTTFIPKYYLDKTQAQNGTANPLVNGWLLTANTKLYVRIESIYNCTPVIGEITLTIGNKVNLIKNTYSTPGICNDNFQGVSVNLSNYNSQFTTDPTVNVIFYNSLNEAKAAIAGTSINPNQNLNDTKTFGIRLENATDCPNVASLTVNIKSPKKSTVLQDKKICGNSTVVLDAGSGFDHYLWSDGTTSQTITAGIGEYFVDLFFDQCVYRQTVKVTAAEIPVITHVDVVGNTVTIFATGGNAPYQYEYSIDGTNFQTSNVFFNVPRGVHTAYVKDSENCGYGQKQFLILNLINAITPNGDGINDVLNYSDLKMKKDVKMEIFDRFGNKVFKASDHYIWDGKLNGRILPSGTYWYLLNWTEPDSNLPVSYQGWVLIKNRN